VRVISKVEVLRFIADVGDRGTASRRYSSSKRFRISDKAAVRWLDRLWADKLITPTVAGIRTLAGVGARRFVMTARGLDRLTYWETGASSSGTFELR